MRAKALAITLVVAILFSFFFFGSLVHSVSSQFVEDIFIRADGSVEGTDKIQRDGNVYTLTGNISGGIQVQKSYVVIDGAGNAVEGDGEYRIGVDLSNGVGQNPSHATISNVTVKNLKIVNCYYALSNENTYNNTFIGNYISECDTGFWITGSGNNTLIHNTIKNCTTGISINYDSGGNVIVENNIMSSVSVWLSPDPLVDRNYWSDYLERYPNAKEIDNSGIWDTSYDRETFIDNHPLVEPVSVIPEFSSPLFALPIMVAVSIGLLFYFKKRKH